MAAADGDHVTRVGSEARFAARNIDRAGGIGAKDRRDLVDDRLLPWIGASRGDIRLGRRGGWRDPGDRLRICLERPAERTGLPQRCRADQEDEGRHCRDGPERDPRRTRTPAPKEALPAYRSLRWL